MATTPSKCYYWLGGDSLNVNLLKWLIKTFAKPPTFTNLHNDGLFKTKEENHYDLGNFNKSECETSSDCLRIVPKQPSLPHMLTEDDDTLNRRRSETYVDSNTTLRAKHAVKNSPIPKVSSKYLAILEYLLEQAQLRTYQTQHAAREKGVCFEAIESVQYKEDNSEVANSDHFLPDQPRAYKNTKLIKSPMHVGRVDLPTPCAAYTKATKKAMFPGIAEMLFTSRATKRNTLVTPTPNTKHKGNLQNPYNMRVKPARVKSLYKKEPLQSNKELPKPKGQKQAREKNKVQPLKISPDEFNNHDLLPVHKTVPCRKSYHKVKKVAGLGHPFEIKAVTEEQEKVVAKKRHPKTVTENGIVRTFTTLPVEINIPLHENLVRGRDTAMKASSVIIPPPPLPSPLSSRHSLNKSTTKVNKKAKTIALTPRYPFERFRKPNGDCSLASLIVNRSVKIHSHEDRNLHDHGIRENILSYERNCTRYPAAHITRNREPVKVTNIEKPTVWSHNKTKPILTLFEQSPKPKLIQPRVLVHTRIPATERTAFRQNRKIERQRRRLPIITEKGKFTSTQFTGLLETLQGKIIPNEDKFCMTKCTDSPKVIMESEKTPISTVKNQIRSSSYIFSLKQYNKNRRKLNGRVSLAGDNEVAVRNDNKHPDLAEEPQMESINQIGDNKCRPESNELSLLRKRNTAPQKDSIRARPRKVVRPPNNRLVTQKYNVRNAEPKILGLPFLPPDTMTLKELPNEITEEFDKCKGFSALAANAAVIKALRILPILDPDETVTVPKVNTDVSKKKHQKDTAEAKIKEDNKTASRNKMKLQADVVIKNILKPDDMALGDSVLSNDKKSKMTFVHNVKENCTMPAMFPDSQRGRNYAPCVDSEYMTATQKSVLRVLKTYLANIEADLLSELE